MPLTKRQAKYHREASDLLDKETLTFDEKLFVLNNFHEGGDTNNVERSGHFTPHDLACDFAIDVGGTKILDLCAGIGMLSFAYLHYRCSGVEQQPSIVCVESCTRYVEVGKKVLPEATWICGDIFDPDLLEDLKARNFSTAIGNPPFGKNAMNGRRSPRYEGRHFEYAALDVASLLAASGTFIVPQGSSPFVYSGARCYQDRRDDLHLMAMKEYRRFRAQTGVELHAGCGVDTSIYREAWKGVSPTVEIVTFENEECFLTVGPKPMTITAPESSSGSCRGQGSNDQFSLF